MDQDYIDQLLSSFKRIEEERAIADEVLADLDEKHREGLEGPQNTIVGFDIGKLDTRSFKQQHSRFDETFVADENVSFLGNDRKKHEFFLELDNRTETNSSNVDKIINYINYARNNPESQILMEIAYADGAVPTKKIPTFSFIPRKISNLTDKFMRTAITSPKGNKYYLAALLQQTPNLSVSVSQVSEAQFDPAEFYLESNFKEEALKTIEKYVDFINRNQAYDWSCSFEPSSKDMSKSYRQIGTITYSHNLEFIKYIQPVLLGREHDLDTVIEFHLRCLQSLNSEFLSAPCVVYPTRDRPLYAISLRDDANMFAWAKIWRPKLPIFIQPTYSLSDSQQLRDDLQLIVDEYSSSIFRYFTTGGLNASDLKNNKVYEQSFLPSTSRRSYQDLRKLANELGSERFIKQLRIEEVPISVFKALLNRGPIAFNPSLIQDRPFLKYDLYKPTEYPDVASWISYPNSINPESREKPFC